MGTGLPSSSFSLKVRGQNAKANPITYPYLTYLVWCESTQELASLEDLHTLS